MKESFGMSFFEIEKLTLFQLLSMSNAMAEVYPDPEKSSGNKDRRREISVKNDDDFDQLKKEFEKE